MALTTLPPDCKASEINAAMARDGACIVEDLMDSATLDAVNTDTGQWIERSRMGGDDFVGRYTKRTGALIARCPTTHDIILNPLVLEAADLLLGPYCERVQLHLTQTISIYPGQGPQYLHRDRLAWGGYLPKPIEPQFNTIWALTDFDEQNGATRVVPGSHLWDLDREAKPEDPIQASMARGSVLLYSGTVVHGGGANRSDDVRVGMNITYCLSWLRQEENQYLSCPPEIARELPQDLTDLMGYTMGNYALGYFTQHDEINGAAEMTPPETAVGKKPPLTFT